MALVTTSAVVLRTYPYSETSKIVRLATRDLGVQSAIAKGVLRPRSRFAAGLGRPRGGRGPPDHPGTRRPPPPAPFAPPGVAGAAATHPAQPGPPACRRGPTGIAPP